MTPNLVAALFVATHLLPALGVDIYSSEPWDTYCLAALWLWCGWLWVTQGPGEVRWCASDPMAGLASPGAKVDPFHSIAESG
jgi:hypothetical protein